MVTRQQWSDAFNNQVSNRTNTLDLPSHYRYSPERWRFFKNGSRQFIQYNSIAEYNHATDVHELSPSGGDTVTLESAERPRYVVQYELAVTWAFVVSQSLSGNDQIRVGLYDGTDGWYLEQTGSKHADDEGDIVTERGGSVVNREENVNLFKATTTFARLKLRTAWYNISRQRWERSYSDNKSQANREIIITGIDDGRGPEVGNLPLHYEVTADASTSNLTLKAGSCAQVNLGKTTALTRTKVDQETETVNTTGSWVPLFAIRTDPDKEIINTQLSDIAINEFDGNGDIELIVNAFDPTKVADANGNQLTDSDFSVPAEFSSTNNAIQVSTAVEQVADSTGTLQTSMANPGGFQIGFDALNTGGGNTVTENSPTPGLNKRPLYPRDIAVVLVNAGATGDVTFLFRTEQDW